MTSRSLGCGDALKHDGSANLAAPKYLAVDYRERHVREVKSLGMRRRTIESAVLHVDRQSDFVLQISDLVVRAVLVSQRGTSRTSAHDIRC